MDCWVSFEDVAVAEVTAHRKAGFFDMWGKVYC
jgi:hypothetical protein